MRDSYTNRNHCPSHEMWSYERDGRWWGWSFVRGSTVMALCECGCACVCACFHACLSVIPALMPGCLRDYITIMYDATKVVRQDLTYACNSRYPNRPSMQCAQRQITSNLPFFNLCVLYYISECIIWIKLNGFIILSVSTFIPYAYYFNWSCTE